MNLEEIEKQLKAPFPEDKIKWRVQSSGKGSNGIWARILAYHTARMTMDRLDEVVGVNNWKDDTEMSGDHYKSYLSIKLDDEWITKTGVAEGTNIEAVKGGASDALKRAGVKFGIGRYLYNLEANWPQEITQTRPDNKEGWNKGKVNGEDFYWKPPELPDWATPSKDYLDYIRDQIAEVQSEASDTEPVVDSDTAQDFAIWWKDNVSEDDKDRYEFLSKVTGREIESTKNLTNSELSKLRDVIQEDKEQFVDTALQATGA